MKEFFYTVIGTVVFIHFTDFLHLGNNQNFELIASAAIGLGLYTLLVLVGMFPPKIIADKMYFREASKMGSIANFFGAKGRTWTTASNLKSWSKLNRHKKNLHIDNFFFSRAVRNKISFFGLKQLYHNMPIYIPLSKSGRSGTDALEGMLVLGSAGGGKSQFLLNLFSQNQFNRAIVHDIKGEFIKYFYREEKDIILNSFDKRGAVWDIFKEAEQSPTAIKLFFDSYIENFMDKDFWANSATLQYKKAFEDVLNMPISSLQKWKIYNETIGNMIKEFQESESKAKNSLALVMEMIQEHFVEQEKQLERGAKSFTINDFKDAKDIRLFLLNRAEFSSVLTPFFTAFISVLTVILSSKKDTKEDITLLMLDEYLSFINGMKEQTLTILHTTLRGRGVMVVSAMQSLPNDPDKKTLVFGNNRYYIIYPIMDENTQKTVNHLLGQSIYQERSESQNIEGKKGASRSHQSNEADAVESVIFSTIGGANYAHITFAPTPNKLYIGKNKLFVGQEIAEDFIKI